MRNGTTTSTVKPSALALLPLLAFLTLFFGTGLYHSWIGTDMAFYQLPASVAILPAIALAFVLGRRAVTKQINTLLDGIGDRTIITMCLVFLLAGAFATVMDAIGGVDATVNLGLALLPGSFLLPGLFLISAFISISMGTSMGTVAAVAPIAIGLSDSSGLSLAISLGAVVGGAMFGDNLSIISDTTIASTRTQECAMADKFKANLILALPAAAGTIVLLFFLSSGGTAPEPPSVNLWLVLPYLIVLGLAVAGMNVFFVLSLGIVLSGATGLIMADYNFAAYGSDIYAGFESMIDIMLLSMFIGGLGAMIREQGGMAWLAQSIQRATQKARLRGRRAGETGIAGLVAATDVFTANNTVSILLSGDVARQMARRHGIQRKRSASLLDIFACVTQGILPYGAQLLLVGSLAGLDPIMLVGTVHYCLLLGSIGILSILFGFGSSGEREVAAPTEAAVRPERAAAAPAEA